MKYLTEDPIEEYAGDRLQALHYDYRNGYDIQPEGQNQERESFGEVVLKDQATEGLNIVRPLLSRFPENDRLNQFFAYFSSVLFFVETSRTRRIQTIIERISGADVTEAEIQEAGEDLSTLLSRVLEAKIGVRRIITRLEN